MGGLVNGPKQAAEQVEGAAAGFLAIVEDLREEAARQQADVLGEQRDHALQDEPLGPVALDRLLVALDHRVEGGGNLLRRLARDGDEIVLELRVLGNREKE